MKILLLITLMLSCLSVFAQKDSSIRESWVGVSFKSGNFSNGSSDPKLYGLAMNPVFSIGSKFKMNLGFMIIRFDTTDLSLDTLKQTFDRFQLGLSFEQRIPSTNLYLGGAYDIMPSLRGRGVGNMVSIRLGYLFDETLDFSVQTSKMYARLPEQSGNIFLFGLGLRF